MKNILITGAGGGMGKEAVRLFSQNGWRVFAFDIVESELMQNVVSVKVDVRDEASVNAALDEVKLHTAKLDAILHFAGVYDMDSLVEIDEKRFVRLFDINFFGIYRINKAFYTMLSQGGRIVMTSSELAPLDPLPFTGLYGLSKTAVEKYADSLRMEAALLGIFVSVIRPGAVKTGLLNASTTALDKMVEHTELYKYNVSKFEKIVDNVETATVTPDMIARTAYRAVTAKRPKYVYNINRNLSLRFLSALPKKTQVWIIRRILTKGKKQKIPITASTALLDHWSVIT